MCYFQLSVLCNSFGQILKHTSRFQFGRLHSLTHLILKLNIDDNSAVTVFIEIFLILRFAKLPYFAKFLFFQSRRSPCISNSFLAFPFLPFLILWKLEMSGSHSPGQIVCRLHSLTANEGNGPILLYFTMAVLYFTMTFTVLYSL